MGLPELYRKIWTRFGGRPWTYIWRDLYHKYELIPQSIFFWWGVGMAFYFKNLLYIGIIWAIYCLGYLMGHCHFGTKYIPNQQEPTGEETADYAGYM